jgi:DNA helicase HerA-like ATPase
MLGGMAGVQERIEAFRALRRELETSVLPMASSVDGRRFVLQAPAAGHDLRVGGYAVLGTPEGDHLAQVLGLRLESAEIDAGDGGRVLVRAVRGEGELLGGPARAFHDAHIRPAAPDEVAAWLGDARTGRARLPIGELRLAAGVPWSLDAGGFDRHTFMCGQSGSGKTYSLGVLLERLLLETRLRIVVLDPNSDFVRLHELRDGVREPDAGRWRALAGDIAVHTAAGAGAARLRLRLAELDPGTVAALLRLDPVADSEAYAELMGVLAEQRPPSLERLLESDSAGARHLLLRIGNLGVGGFGVWARDDPGSTVHDAAAGAVRCLVVDLGSLATAEERALVAEATLAALWRGRERREPVLIVIDEAHNVCPAAPEDLLTARATEIAVRIAAEGRKFGLYLLASTQRPQKVHENVLSQCDNLVLMRLNSAADAALVQARFSFVPAGLLDQASGFGLGEAIVAGKIAPHPALVRFGARVAQEGGADVPSDWAAV